MRPAMKSSRNSASRPPISTSTSAARQAFRARARSSRSGLSIAGSAIALADLAEAPGEDRLLGVDAVFRLVPDQRAGPVDDRVADFLAPVRRQAVQEHRPAVGHRHQAFVDLIGLEGVQTGLAVDV